MDRVPDSLLNRLSRSVTVPLRPRDFAALRREARRRDMPISSAARDLLLDALRLGRKHREKGGPRREASGSALEQVRAEGVTR